ncbi:hypothetical protein KY360_00550 [Candidatus Woesearchaeota archaeon]|nr:hypothetical protein [Candidatus Woesearchaeota archaeon]
MKKKAQMELMGIAIVVLIVSMIMVFVLSSVSRRKPEEHRERYAESELATNVVKTLLYATAPDCYDMTFNELIQNCVENFASPSQRVQCEDYYARDSCYYVLGETGDILSTTLGKWQVDYEFRVVWGNMNRFGTTSPTNLSVGGCPADSISQRTRPYTVTTGAGVANIMLYVCH